MTRIIHHRSAAVAAALCLSLAATATASARVAAEGSLTGTVTSDDGTPVARAAVLLYGRGGDTMAKTDASGRFAIPILAPGLYAIRIDASGYNVSTGRTVGVTGDASASVTLTLTRSAGGLVTIGRTRTAAGSSLSTSSVPSAQLDPQTYAARGYLYVSDVLQNDISTTLVHPLGGGLSALPTSVALRGPDPTETLVDIDGHRVNNGNTGDFDLSLLDPVQFSNVELVKGISPSSLVGPDTIDGAINLQTLEPTADPHSLARFTYGSFNAYGETVQTTGTANRLGYALSLHRTTTSGEVNEDILDRTQASNEETIGSAVMSSTAIGKLRYAFGRTGDGYAELTFRDQSQYRDLSAALTTYPDLDDAGDRTARRSAQDEPLLDGFEGTNLRAHTAGYGLDVRAPIGAAGPGGVAPSSLLVRLFRSNVSQSVEGPGADTNPYLYDSGDKIDDDSIEFDRQFSKSTLTLQYDVRNEALATDFVSGIVVDEATGRQFAQSSARRPADDDTDGPLMSTIGLGQTQRSLALRYTYDPTPALHFTGAAYYSRFSLFGSSIDPRFGAVFDPDARTAVRFSVGTTYQAPQLPELFTPPVLPTIVGQAVAVGNPNLQPDRATEYGLGFEHVLETGANRSTISLDLYRVNLRQPAAALQPFVDPNCGPTVEGGDGTACPLTYSVNAGDGVYQGFELQGQRRLLPFTTLAAGFAVRSAYLTNVPPSIQDGTLVVNQQTLGLPLQKATLSLTHAPPLGFDGFASLVYEGRGNELNRPAYATIAAGLGYRLREFELGLTGTNLTDTYDTKFSRPGAGVPQYVGNGTSTPTTAYALQSPTITFAITRRL